MKLKLKKKDWEEAQTIIECQDQEQEVEEDHQESKEEIMLPQDSFDLDKLEVEENVSKTEQENVTLQQDTVRE
ncbi:hypothetical protein PVK06_003486 [Gossypium arboreum]|uniref:Uncharacterized protein n=1 Tax=Gossypium arboreum TaxID=29729 RepID=A0ABR0R6H4_GOSAR|nr:hypothetical protein PVK06_003486 [Gossypium arboreum]